MRHVGAFLISGACIFMGLCYGKRQRDRMDALKSLCTALGLIKGELRTRRLSMPELCTALKNRIGAPASEFFAELEEGAVRLGEESFHSIWDSAAEKCFGLLSREQLSELKILGNTLGRTGLEDETEAIETCLRFIQSSYDEARRAYPSEKKLGLGLGTASAALIVLTLI